MKKILIIDDDPVFAKICESLLHGAEFLVESASDAEMAFERLRNNPPDLVLLDLFMGKINGVQILKQIRTHSTTQATPVIALSSASTSRLVEAAWNAGANRFLAKDHFDPDRFLQLIRATLETPNPYLFGPSEESFEPRPEPPDRSNLPPAPPLMAAFAPLGPLIGALGSLQSQLRRALRDGAPPIVNSLLQRTHAVATSDVESVLASGLQELGQMVHALTRQAAPIGFHRIEHFGGVLEALLRELQDNPEYRNASSWQTVIRAMEVLAALLQHKIDRDLEELTTALALVVDDEATSRWMIQSSLEPAHVKSICLDDPRQALGILEDNAVDLIFIDWQMPGMNGIELCSAIRALPRQRRTPLVFVTGRADFETRARSTLSGGDDFMAKPFLPAELAARALTHVMGSWLKGLTPSR